MAEDFVADDEILYRRVPGDNKDCIKLENGKYRPTQVAFSDRKLKTSVDRARLKGNNPANSQQKPTDYVVSLLTAEVYALGGQPRKALGDEARLRVIVTPDPVEDDPDLPDNPAHALIRAAPDFDVTDKDEIKIFRKLTVALARLAADSWEIGPS